MFVQQYFVEGLGCASYLIADETTGQALVVDPDRDIQPYLRTAAQMGFKITHIVETHLHADHVSGNLALSAASGAPVYLHAEAQVAFPAQYLKDGDQLQLGQVQIEVRHTPGHTPESITLLVSDLARAAEPMLALTGDTLFVGDIGRPDLVGMDSARQLAASLHHSLHNKLLPLDDGLLIYPGHGAGSLCGKAIGAMRSTTLGYERKHNPALAIPGLADFVSYSTSNLPEQPANHERIKQINRRGPAPLGPLEPQPLSIEQSVKIFQRGAGLLDLRPKAAYIQKHIPGSVNLELRQISNQIGFIAPPDLPLVLLLEDPQQYQVAVIALQRVGYERVSGYLAEDLEAWERRGLPVTAGDIEDISPRELHHLLEDGSGGAPFILDVREPWEYAQGHLPGARLIPLGRLAQRLEELDPQTPVAVVCAHGARSQSAAALLGQKNFKKVFNLTGGTTEWVRQGYSVER